jgi:hypothetical protein
MEEEDATPAVGVVGLGDFVFCYRTLNIFQLHLQTSLHHTVSSLRASIVERVVQNVR